MELSFGKYYISLEYKEYCIGFGWWKGSCKFFVIDTLYYDGYWSGIRFGPFFASRGPY